MVLPIFVLHVFKGFKSNHKCNIQNKHEYASKICHPFYRYVRTSSRDHFAVSSCVKFIMSPLAFLRSVQSIFTS